MLDNAWQQAFAATAAISVLPTMILPFVPARASRPGSAPLKVSKQAGTYLLNASRPGDFGPCLQALLQRADPHVSSLSALTILVAFI